MKREREAGEELCVLGSACSVWDEPLLAAKLDSESHLLPHPHDERITLDRYDARLLLEAHELREASQPGGGREEEGSELREERWRGLQQAEREAAEAERHAAAEAERELQERASGEMAEGEEEKGEEGEGVRERGEATAASQWEKQAAARRASAPLLSRVVDFVLEQVRAMLLRMVDTMIFPPVL